MENKSSANLGYAKFLCVIFLIWRFLQDRLPCFEQTPSAIGQNREEVDHGLTNEPIHIPGFNKTFQNICFFEIITNVYKILEYLKCKN